MPAKQSPLDQICSPEEAAAILGLTAERVLQFCRQGRIESRKIGRDWIIVTASLREFADAERPTGVYRER